MFSLIEEYEKENEDLFFLSSTDKFEIKEEDNIFSDTISLLAKNSIEKSSNLEKEKDIPEPINKIEQKRMKSRVRSKKARERKKYYIQELEHKIKMLEEENCRLQNHILTNRSQELNNTSDESKNLLDELKANKYDLLETFVDSESCRYNEKVPISSKDYFIQNNPKIFNSHKKLLEHSFDMIFTNFSPICKHKYWKDLSEDSMPSYEQINRYKKLKKFEKHEFAVENNLNLLDQFLSALEPNKRQYDFMTKFILKKELEIKNVVKEGYIHLIKAKNLIMKSLAEMNILVGVVLKSEVFNDKQTTNGYLSFDSTSQNNNIVEDIFGFKKEQKNITIDPLSDTLLKKLPKKYSKKGMSFSYEYSTYLYADQKAE